MRVFILTIFLTTHFCTPIFGQCIIDDLIVEAHPCENGTFLIDLDFNAVGTSDSFTIVGNGNNYGTFAYSELYLTLGPFEGDGITIYEFIVTDVNNSDCTAFTGIDPVDCSGGTDCELSNLEVSIGDCNPDGTYFLTFDFDYQNTTNDFFDLFVNETFFGFYEFANLPVTIPAFPPSGNTYDYIQVCQNDLPDCCTDLEFESPNCNDECELWDLEVTNYGDCTSDSTYSITINFLYENVSNDFFDLFANGEFLSFHAFDNLPLTIENFPASGNDFDYIQICQNDLPTCCTDLEFEAPNCQEVTSIENPITKQLQIYPNPAQDFIFIKNEMLHPIQEIIILDALGKTKKIIRGNSEQIDISESAKGVYFLQIKNDGNWWSEKLMIHKN